MNKIFFLIIFIFSYGDSNTSSNIKSYFLYENFTMEYFLDESNSLEFKDIKTIDLFKKTNSKYSFGYQRSTLWLKIDFHNRSLNENFIINLNEFFYDEATLYYFNKSKNSFEKKQNGVLIPLEVREIQDSKISFKFFIEKNDTQTLYLKLKAKYPYVGNIIIFNEEYILKNKILSIDFFYIFTLGTFAIIILFNLFLGFNLKEKIYIFYASYAICVSYYLFKISGMLVYFNLQEYIYKTYFVTALGIMFFILFTIEYLDLRKNLPNVIPIYKTLVALLFICSIVSIYQYAPINKYFNILILLTFLTFIISSLIIYIKGYRKAKYYLFAIIIYFTFVIVFILLLTGVLENSYFTRYGYLFTLYFEVVFFSLMLAGRYNDIKNKQIKTQNKFLNLKENQNKILTQEVAKQTNKLNETNEKLKNSLKERELLLKEIFHRVKNNFHMINGMLWFESKKHVDKDIFTELSNRINSMSKLHEHLLYSSENLSEIQANEYFKDLLTSIEVLYSNKNFSLHYKIQNFSLDFDEALSLGIVINEIINNSIKYGKDLKNNKINLKLKKQENKIFLYIKDSGKGFSQNFTKGLGLNLVDEFCSKFEKPDYEFLYEDGLIFRLKFTQGAKSYDK